MATLQTLEVELARLSNGSNYSKLIVRMGEVVKKQADDSFKQKRFTGNPNEKWKERKAFGGEKNIRYPMLQYTGALRRSIYVTKPRIMGSGSVKNYSVRVTSRKKYAGVHNEGGISFNRAVRTPPAIKKGRYTYTGKVPHRRFIGVGSLTKIKLNRLIREESRIMFGKL